MHGRTGKLREARRNAPKTSLIACGTHVPCMSAPPQMGAMMAIVIGQRTRKYSADMTEPASTASYRPHQPLPEPPDPAAPPAGLSPFHVLQNNRCPRTLHPSLGSNKSLT